MIQKLGLWCFVGLMIAGFIMSEILDTHEIQLRRKTVEIYHDHIFTPTVTPFYLDNFFKITFRDDEVV